MPEPLLTNSEELGPEEKLNQSGAHLELYDFSFQGQNIHFFTVGYKELM